nr:hypothetical protein [Ensifer sp. Root127]
MDAAITDGAKNVTLTTVPAARLESLLTIDATDVGSEEISPKNRTSPLRDPSAMATEIFNFDVSKPMKITLPSFMVRPR